MHDAPALTEPINTMSHILQTERITYGQLNHLKASDRLNEIMDPKTASKSDNNYFHMEQQTNRTLCNHNLRSRLSHERHRHFIEKETTSPANSYVLKDVDPFEVTLTMQISNLENELYKKIIPEYLPEIMSATDTIIRLPDHGEFGLIACQVLIRGTPKNVEVARTRVRSLTAVSMSFTAENNKYRSFDDLKKWLNDKIPKLPKDLIFHLNHGQRKQYFEKMTIQVTGTFKQEEQIVQCLNQLRSDLFSANEAEQILIITEINVPHTQMENFTGGERPDQLIAIARAANVFLHFMPVQSRYQDANYYPPPQNFIITGIDPQGVFHALKIMTALQPIQLSFNVLGNDLVLQMDRPQTKKIFDDKTQVHMVMMPSLKQIMPTDPSILFACLTTQEHNMGNIYHTMRTMLKKKMDAENKVPICKTPTFMNPVNKQLQVLARQLDIQNCEFPDAIMNIAEKVETYLLERSTDTEEMENPLMELPLGIPDGDRNMLGPVESMPMINPEVLNYIQSQEYMQHTFEGSPILNQRYDGYNQSRTFQRGGLNVFRGNRRLNGNSNFNIMERRPTNFQQRNRFNRDRDFEDRRPREQMQYRRNGTINESDKSTSSTFREVVDRPRIQGKNYNRRPDMTYDSNYMASMFMQRPPPPINQSLMDRSVEQYKKTDTEQYKKPEAEAYKKREKVILPLNTSKASCSHNSTLEEDSEISSGFPKRITPKELFDTAIGDRSSISIPSSENVEGNRITYARVVGRAPHKSERNGNIGAVNETKMKNLPQRKRSFSSNESTIYSRDSPFATGRQLDRRVDVDHVLFSINCDKYLDAFRKAKITSLPAFQNLEENNLLSIGVTSSLDRATIMEYIHKLREVNRRNNAIQTGQSRSNHV